MHECSWMQTDTADPRPGCRLHMNMTNGWMRDKHTRIWNWEGKSGVGMNKYTTSWSWYSMMKHRKLKTKREKAELHEERSRYEWIWIMEFPKEMLFSSAGCLNVTSRVALPAVLCPALLTCFSQISKWTELKSPRGVFERKGESLHRTCRWCRDDWQRAGDGEKAIERYQIWYVPSRCEITTFAISVFHTLHFSALSLPSTAYFFLHNSHEIFYAAEFNKNDHNFQRTRNCKEILMTTEADYSNVRWNPNLRA